MAHSTNCMNIGVCGASKIGKTSLIVQFVSCHFREEGYDDVICCCCEPAKKQISVDGLTALLYLDDFDLSIHYHEYLKKIDGFVLIYDITSRSSVEELLNIKELIDCYKNENAPLVLVGNKIDLESQRQISTEEGQKLAAK